MAIGESVDPEEGSVYEKRGIVSIDEIDNFETF